MSHIAATTHPRRTRRTQPRQPRPVVADTMGLVLRQATRLTAVERERILRPLHAAWKALREGVGSLQQWQVVDSHNSLSQAIESQGIVRGLDGHFIAAQQALGSIYARAWSGAADPTVACTGHWTPTALHWHEIDAVSTGLELFEFQLQHLSAHELGNALHLAVQRVTEAGGRVVVRG